jgi:4-carboxymuconolactone decarboxylase
MMRLSDEVVLELLGDRKYTPFTRIFRREGLTVEQRLLSSIASLQASGNTQGLAVLLDLAIDDQEDLVFVYEILLQGYLFCGYPRAIESLFCLDQVLSGKEGIGTGLLASAPEESSEALMKRGIITARKVHGDKFERIHNKISALSPDLGYLMLVEGYGRILSRPGLDIRTRELAVVASLATTRAPRQLGSHIRGCRNVGCGDSEIYESIFTCQLWAPDEHISEALGIWAEITGGTVEESIGDRIF